MAQGCYIEPYLPASYKGIAFTAIDVSSDHGRRGAEGEFPFGEDTSYADLGRRIRTYKMSARFDGNDHVLQAGLLIAACELTGPGVLTHPTRGVILKAACRSLTVSDKIETDGGVTYLDMEFVEANDWPNGLSLVGQFLGLALGTVINVSRDHFRATYVPATVQNFRRELVVNSLQEQLANINAAYTSATVASASVESRNRIIRDLDEVSADLGRASDVTTADKGLALGMNALALELAGQDKFDAFRSIANGASQVSTYQSPALQVQNVIYANTRVIAAAYMAEGALEATDQRTSEVFANLDVIANLLEQERLYARNVCANELLLALQDFSTEVSSQLYAKAYSSPGLIEYNFSGKVHPLTAAYAILSDAKKLREIETFNVVGSAGRVGPKVAAEQGLN